MLHALPALLDDLEARIVHGEDPLPLLTSIHWPEVVGWPQELAEARKLKARLTGLKDLIHGLQAPLRATLMGLRAEPTYSLRGMSPQVPLSMGRLPEGRLPDLV